MVRTLDWRHAQREIMLRRHSWRIPYRHRRAVPRTLYGLRMVRPLL